MALTTTYPAASSGTSLSQVAVAAHGILKTLFPMPAPARTVLPEAPADEMALIQGDLPHIPHGFERRHREHRPFTDKVPAGFTSDGLIIGG